eukprot:gnl/Chilomastix_cuspidata/5686.p1 GENE.gnl/Chilomastix_cuspidata/5686~~gnl/Chilomastix_cuspidata/5686.p1  ORF type:complete len:361 (-),score=138.85 gnl/Chilomastix_cuspidata/5686:522-1604(-)
MDNLRRIIQSRRQAPRPRKAAPGSDSSEKSPETQKSTVACSPSPKRNPCPQPERTPLDPSKETSFPPIEDVKKRLRKLDLPVTLFGESESERWERLRKAEMAVTSQVLGHGGGSREWSAALEELARGEGADVYGKSSRWKAKILTLFDESRRLEAHPLGSGASLEQFRLIEAERGTVKDRERGPELRFEDTEEMRRFRGIKPEAERAPTLPANMVALWVLRRLFREWQLALALAPDAAEVGTMLQSKFFIAPLLRRLRRDVLDQDVSEKLAKMCRCVLAREYREAEEVFFRITVGNNPWPLGVTAVGIHERKGRAKIFTDNIEHPLDEEEVRRYSQAVYRLITFAKKRFPPQPKAKPSSE